MKIIKQSSRYILADMEGTIFEKRYQILEITPDFPKGATRGVYQNKKDALQAYGSWNGETK